MVGEDNVGIHLDAYHMNIEEEDFETPVRLAGDRLVHFHLSESHRGVPGRGRGRLGGGDARPARDRLRRAGRPGVLRGDVARDAAATCIWRDLAPEQRRARPRGPRLPAGRSSARPRRGAEEHGSQADRQALARHRLHGRHRQGDRHHARARGRARDRQRAHERHGDAAIDDIRAVVPDATCRRSSPTTPPPRGRGRRSAGSPRWRSSSTTSASTTPSRSSRRATTPGCACSRPTC